jgi:hypothetical protein
MGLASVSAWALGHADSARERIGRGVALARAEKDRYQLTIGRYFEGLLHGFLREPRPAEAASKQALAISEEHGFTLYRGACILLGWAKAHLGSASEGVSLIRQALAGYSEAGEKAETSLLLTILAKAQTLDGAFADALTTIENAAKADILLVYVPNTLLCRGELRRKIGDADLPRTISAA